MEEKLRHMTVLSPYSIALLLLLSFLASMPRAFAQEETALILRGESSHFQETFKGLSEDLEGELVFVDQVVSKQTTAQDVATYLKQHNPTAVVLMGNRAINAYTDYQKANSGAEFPPSILMAALYVDKYIQKVENSVGILYEIPAVTSVVNLRSISQKPIKRVGVIYREWMASFIENNRKFCEQEGIELVAMQIDNDEKKFDSKVKKYIKKLEKKGVDAYWILNDNSLLSPQVIVKAWQPGLKKSKRPVIVGVDSLVSSKLNFGTFAIVPDHYALGIQGASMLADIMDNDWEIEESRIEQPLSVKKILNLAISNTRKIKTDMSKIGEVDIVIE